jgi:hypothetical protein
MGEKIKRTRNLWKSLTILFILSVAIWSISSTPMYVHATTPPIMTTFKVEPETFIGKVGDTVTLAVNVYDAQDLWGWQVLMSWNATVLGFLNLTFGGFLSGQPDGSTTMKQIDYVDDGWLMATETTFGDYPGVTTDFGWLMSVEFEILNLPSPPPNELEATEPIDIDSEYTYWLDSTLGTWGDDPGEMIKENGYYTVWNADVNIDGFVDILDLAYVAINWGDTGEDIQPPRADVNRDGVIDILDLSAVAIRYGQYVG